MALLKKETFEELSQHHAPHCYSIFIPTSRYGEEVLRGKDEIQFKKLLQDVRRGLAAEGLNERELDQILQPARDLLEDTGFWRKQSDGLAVFGSDDHFAHFTLPIRFEPQFYLADHYYVQPLIPLFNGDGRFFLLRISLHGAKLFEGTRHTLTEVYIEDLTPARLEEVVGYDYEEKSLQFRTGEGGAAGAQFHGQGRSDDKRKEEVLQYLRAVDKGLMQLLHDERDPLLVSCVDYQYPLYREANNYHNLVEEHLRPQAEPDDLPLLHERAWKVLAPHFAKHRQDKMDRFADLSATGKTSVELEEVVAAAVNGRIDTLFISEEAGVFGMYQPAENKVMVQDRKDFANASLSNLAAVHTLRQQGDVFILPADELPVPQRPMNALFRY